MLRKVNNCKFYNYITVALQRYYKVNKNVIISVKKHKKTLT